MSTVSSAVKLLGTTSIFITIFGDTWGSNPQSANGQQTDPPPVVTGRTADPSTRGDCPVLSGNAVNLTALTPHPQGKVTVTVTVTLSQNPTFRFYSPYIRGKYRFRILEERQSRDALYTQDITGYDKAGIFAVSLPVLSQIQPKEYYFWDLEYLCSNKPNATNPMVYGLLYRDRLTTAQQLEFNKIRTDQDRIIFYENHGIWSERLDEIVRLLPVSQLLWQKTLEAEGLQSVAKASVLFVQP